MKKSLFLLLALVILLGGCGPKSAEVKKPQAEKISGSIEELLAKNKSIKCELITKEGEDIISGTTYIADGKARSDYKNKMGGQTVTSHMITDNTWLYTWTEEYPNQAVKMNVESMQAAQGTQQAQESGYENYQNKFNYDCYNWVKDNSVFTPPANVNFIDYSEMMQSLQGLLGNINSEGNNPNLQNTNPSSMCAACSSISDAKAKESCKSQLGCK